MCRSSVLSFSVFLDLSNILKPLEDIIFLYSFQKLFDNHLFSEGNYTYGSIHCLNLKHLYITIHKTPTYYKYLFQKGQPKKPYH